MLTKKKPFVLAGLIIALLAGVLTAISPLEAKENARSETRESKLQAYLKFTKILNMIENQYVDEVNTTALINKALKGLMTNLDAHSTYMDAKAFKDLNVQTKGEFGGLGIVVGMRDGALTVIAPIDDTPADKAGVQASDIILKIDNKVTLGMTIDEAVKLMRGKPKTSIILTIVRKGQAKPMKIKIVRDIIHIQSVKVKTIGAKKEILYIHITSFDAQVTQEVTKALAEHPDTKGIIFDLRNNPGGLLNQATQLLDMFIAKGPLVSQKGRNPQDNSRFAAHAQGTDTTTPIVVLVNGGSASASEIVSGALQDTHRAVLVGEKTFGKGSVQVVIPIGQEDGLKLTIARYYLPSGRTIQNKGVTPDVIIHPGKVSRDDKESFSLKERDLKQHLQSELTKIDTNATAVPNSETQATDANASAQKDKFFITEETLYEDAQLKSATDILRVLMLTQKGNKR
jgi:carboxyl-terminal processing protease